MKKDDSYFDVINRLDFFIKYVEYNTFKNNIYSKDLVQDALLITLNKDVEHFRSYFIQTLKLLIKVFNRKQKLLLHIENIEVKTAENEEYNYCLADVNVSELKKSLFSLKNSKKEAIFDYFLQKKTPVQIAKLVGWTNRSVSKEINRIIKQVEKKKAPKLGLFLV